MIRFKGLVTYTVLGIVLLILLAGLWPTVPISHPPMQPSVTPRLFFSGA